MRTVLGLLLTGSLLMGGVAAGNGQAAPVAAASSGQAAPAATAVASPADRTAAQGEDRNVERAKAKKSKQAKQAKNKQAKRKAKQAKKQRQRAKQRREARERARQRRPKPTPTPKPIPTPSPTPKPSPSPTPTPTPTPSPTPSPSVPPGPTTPPATSVTVPGTDCPAFPADNYWNTRVDALPVHARSADWMTSIGVRNLHPDFGPSYGEQSLPYGIPVTVVAGSHPKVPVVFDYDDESDQVGYPLGDDTLIEGGREAGGDRHTIVVDASTCVLYETWNTWPGNPWTAGSGAVWNLRSNALRPAGWTSADAAGLPILPGLLSVEDVSSGELRHAIRFTASRTRSEYIWPARHLASSNSSLLLPPMGARFRLKNSFSTAGFSAQAQVVLRGMQRYGLVLADNGSSWYFQGTADTRWPENLVSELKRIPSSAFEAADTSGMKVAENSGQARQ